MPVRGLPLILGALVLAMAPLGAAGQEFYISPTQRTDGTPSDREAQNGVFDVKHKPAVPGQKPGIVLGEVQTAPRIEGVRPEDVAARYVPQATPYTTDPPPAPAPPGANPADQAPSPKTAGAPVDSSSENKAVPPGTDPRPVRPAEAFPPERIEKTPRAGSLQPAPKDDPRSVEENKDSGG